MSSTTFDFDVLVIGSGFGGSVAALRLTEKGYKVGVVEAGPRFEDEDFASGTFDLKRYLWAPAIGCYGIQRIDAVRDTLIVAGAGVGGGSLVYANTLYEPLDQFYKDPQWSGITDWKDELAPYYDQAKRMLGVVENPVHTPADEVMAKVASDMGVGDTFHPTPVGVFFGGPSAKPGEQVEDPFFGGEGPARNACLNCGECMSGCRHNAKNTLVKNYLYLAEKRGAKVLPLTTVTRINPRDGGGYDVRVKYTKAKRATAKNTRTITAEHVVMAAASLGTQKLLHRMKDEGHLPRLSDRLGFLSRTNSESILGAIAPKSDTTDYSYGVAITSSFHPDEHTHIEPCRYGKGFNTMAMMQTVLTDGDGDEPRWQTWLKQMWNEKKQPPRALRPQALVRAHRHRAGHAEPRQLHHHLRQEDPLRLADDVQAGPRRAQPDLDPGRQRRRTPDRRRPRRHARRQHRRAVQHAADRPLHRRLRHRHLARDRRRRPLPAGLRPPRPARRRRVGHLGQPRRQPVADHHRPGRARHGAVAQQGRGRPAARPWATTTAGSTRPAAPPGGPADGLRSPPAAHRQRLLRTFRTSPQDPGVTPRERGR